MANEASPVGEDDATMVGVKLDAAGACPSEEEGGKSEGDGGEPNGDVEVEGLGGGDLVRHDLRCGVLDLRKRMAHVVEADPFGASGGADFEVSLCLATGFDEIDDGDFTVVFGVPLEAEDVGALHDLDAVAAFDRAEGETEFDGQRDEGAD